MLRIFIFFFLFPPHLALGGLYLKTVYLFVGAPAIAGFLFFLRSREPLVSVVVLSLASSLLYFFGVFLATGLRDPSMIESIFNGLLLFFAAYFFARIYSIRHKTDPVGAILADLWNCGVVHGAIVILTFISEDFRAALYTFVGITDTAERYLFGDVQVMRFQGIVPSGFSFLSATHGLLFAAGLWRFLSLSSPQSIWKITVFVLKQGVLFGSILLIGRTGLIFALLALVVSFSILPSSGGRRANGVIVGSVTGTRFDHRKSKAFFVSVCFIVVALFSIDWSAYRGNIEFAFELMLALVSDGTLDRTMSGVINDHWFFQGTLSQWAFGDGNFGRSPGLPYIDSDVGYVLVLHGGGVSGMLAAYLPFLTILAVLIMYGSRVGLASKFSLFTLALIALGNAKDSYLYSQIGYSQILFLMVSLALFSAQRSRPRIVRQSDSAL